MMNAYETAAVLYAMGNHGADGTIDTWGEDLPEGGFFVGGVRESLVYKHPDSMDRGDIGWFVGTTESRYFGIWTDTDDNKIYIDAVTHVGSCADALELAKLRSEIAVWDVANAQEIRL